MSQESLKGISKLRGVAAAVLLTGTALVGNTNPVAIDVGSKVNAVLNNGPTEPAAKTMEGVGGDVIEDIEDIRNPDADPEKANKPTHSRVDNSPAQPETLEELTSELFRFKDPKAQAAYEAAQAEKSNHVNVVPASDASKGEHLLK